MAGSSSTTRTDAGAPVGLATSYGDGEPELGPGAGVGGHVDRPAMGLHDGLANGEPHAARRAALAPPERLEDALPVEAGHADPLVGDADLHHPGPGHGL